MSKATLKSISEATGFSVTTVSRALAGYNDVNPETRQKIISEARRQNYEPNLTAQLLQGQRTQTIGLIAPTFGAGILDLFYSEFTAGVSFQAAASGYDLMLTTVLDDPDDLAPYRRLVTRRRVDGVILARTSHQDKRVSYLLDVGFPFVAFGRTDAHEGYPYIDVDGEEGQYLITRHFIEQGYERIAYITPPRGLTFTTHRTRGFHRAMREGGVMVDNELVIAGDLSERAGKEITERLLDMPHPPQAILTGNDLMAYGAMQAIQERGLLVGDDVAVGGFDNIRSSAFVHPGLTTMHQPIFEIGQLLTTMLSQIIAGQHPADSARLLQPELIIRGSSGRRHY